MPDLRYIAARLEDRVLQALFPGRVGEALYRATHPFKARFRCPLCGYRGPFRESRAPWGNRHHSMCPRCGSNERARLQHLVVERLRATLPLSTMTLFHFSPERALQPYFRSVFSGYRTAGLWSEPVDHPADLTALPFADASCDAIFASHVLEHVRDDRRALAEIRRVLKVGGIAILPVPVVEPKTIEYGEPNAIEAGHVRAPGRDYYDRYREFFPRVEVFESGEFPEEFQTWSIEDRSVFPTAQLPGRTAMPGERHPDYVPVCFR